MCVCVCVCVCVRVCVRGCVCGKGLLLAVAVLLALGLLLLSIEASPEARKLQRSLGLPVWFSRCSLSTLGGLRRKAYCVATGTLGLIGKRCMGPCAGALGSW